VQVPIKKLRQLLKAAVTTGFQCRSLQQNVQTNHRLATMTEQLTRLNDCSATQLVNILIENIFHLVNTNSIQTRNNTTLHLCITQIGKAFVSTKIHNANWIVEKAATMLPPSARDGESKLTRDVFCHIDSKSLSNTINRSHADKYDWDNKT
jgi:hypothetical protein